MPAPLEGPARGRRRLREEREELAAVSGGQGVPQVYGPVRRGRARFLGWVPTSSGTGSNGNPSIPMKILQAPSLCSQSAGASPSCFTIVRGRSWGQRVYYFLKDTGMSFKIFVCPLGYPVSHRPSVDDRGDLIGVDYDIFLLSVWGLLLEHVEGSRTLEGAA